MCSRQLMTLVVVLFAAASTGPLAAAARLRAVVEGRLGEPLTLNCSDSHPTPGLWWRHKGYNVSSAPWLQLPALSCEDLGTYTCLHNSEVLEVVDVEVQDAQCTDNDGLFVPIVAALSCAVAILLCLTLFLMCGLWKSKRKHRRGTCRGHDNQIQQNNINEELQEVVPEPQEEDRPHPSIVTEPLPSPPPPSPSPDPTPENGSHADPDGIRLDQLGYVKIDPAKGPSSRHTLWAAADTDRPIPVPPRRRAFPPWHEDGALSQAMPLHSQSSRTFPTSPVRTRLLETVSEEHPTMYVGVRARPDMLTYTSHVQYETMASKVFTTHDMEQEQASDTDTILYHGYQNVADWWSTGKDDLNRNLTAAMDSPEHPSGSHGSISESQFSHATTPPTPPSRGDPGNSQAKLLYENLLLVEEDN